MKDKLKIIGFICIILVIISLCGVIVFNAIKSKKEEVVHPVAKFDIENYGTIEMELYPEYAPNTVSNFIALIQAGYYNNKLLSGKDNICVYMGTVKEEEEEEGVTQDEDNYVITANLNEESAESEGIENETTENAVEDNGYKTTKISILDKSIEKDSDADYEYEINGEFVANGFDENTLRHEKGIISFNRSDYSMYGLTKESYNSGKAQFSVMMNDAANLNGIYCAFGKIINGLDVMDNIYNNCAIKVEEAEGENAESTEDESTMKEFDTAPRILNATVETYGVDYGIPETHEAFDIDSYINQLYLRNYSR